MADPSLSLSYRIVLFEKFNKAAIPIFSTTSTFNGKKANSTRVVLPP
jgi:hypothetical protein